MTVEESKLRNIIEMALGFTVMTRVFKKETSFLIKEKLWEVLQNLESIETCDDFEDMHKSFCLWFISNVKLVKSNTSASYGHGAKVLDVVLKVFVYYCNLPNSVKADKILPMLKCAIDTPILKYIIQKYDEEKNYKVYSLTIGHIDESLYQYLQSKVVSDIESGVIVNNTILPVQYDDLIWRKLNR